MLAIFLVTVFSCLLGAAVGAGAVGEACLPGSTCTDFTAVCESNVCKIKVGHTCTTGTTDCVSHSICPSSSPRCTCDSGYTASSSALCIADGAVGGACLTGSTCTAPTSVCESAVCKTKSGQTCATTTECVSQSTCATSTNTCTCNTGYTALTTGLCNGVAPQSVSSWLLTGSIFTLLVTLCLP